MTSNLDLIRGRQVVQTLTNQSGGAIIAGDVVIVSTANDESFTTTTSAAYNSTRVGVALDSIAAAASGRILLEGYAPLVNVSASATRGHYLLTHTVAKQATSQASYAAGAFGQIIKAGTTPSAVIFPVAQVGSAGVARSGSTTGDHLAVWNGSNADSLKDGGAAGGGNYTGVLWSSGTSMPGGPATNQRITRTDLNMDFFYDGTRWLSTALYHCEIPLATTTALSADGVGGYAPLYVGSMDLWLETAYFIAGIAGATNNGSNYWTLEVYKGITGGGSDASIASVNTSAATANQKTQLSVAINALAGTNIAHVYSFGTKTAGNPSPLILNAIVTYRLVGT